METQNKGKWVYMCGSAILAHPSVRCGSAKTETVDGFTGYRCENHDKHSEAFGFQLCPKAQLWFKEEA